MYFSPVSSRRSGCLSQRVSGGVTVSVSGNANANVSVRVLVSESVIVRVTLRKTPLLSRARANVLWKNQREKSMLEAGHVRDARNGSTRSSL